MPPSSTSLLPGPHDPYNASSVKLAEATRICLVLPGLGSCDKDEGSSSAVKRSNTGDLNGKPAESAAALAKARKKLLKIQGIASQANKAHSSIVVDVDVLAGEAAADEEQAAADCRGQASNSSSRDAAGRSSEAVGTHEQRSSKQGAAAGSSASTGAGSAGSQQLKPRRTAACGDSINSRLAPGSPGAAAGDAIADSTGGSSGSRAAAAASSRSRPQPDKPYVPIWERLLPPAAPAEEKKAAATTHRVFQPVALKTFSPTLGSLGSSLAQQDELAAMTARAAAGSSRSRSAAKSQGQPPDVAAGSTAAHWRQGNSARVASKPAGAAAAAADLGLRSQSFTNGYQSPSQLFEKLTLGGPSS